VDILVYGLSERKRALRTARMASSVGYMVVDAEVETRSTRSPDETALDEDAIGERPLPELQERPTRWWLRREASHTLLSLKPVGDIRSVGLLCRVPKGYYSLENPLVKRLKTQPSARLTCPQNNKPRGRKEGGRGK